MLHIRCGDDLREPLAAAGIPGRYLRWVDALADGPLPPRLGGEGWRRLRARYVAHRYRLPPAEVLNDLRRQDAGLRAFAEHDEVVLWFEHDLFDQAVLVRLLDWFSRRRLATTRLSLVSIDRHPAVARFVGLGQLQPAHLAELFGARRPVPQKAFVLARRAWAALRAPDPRPLEKVAAENGSLAFLGPALKRHLAEFPAPASGVGLTHRLTLAAVAAGADSPAAAFRAEAEREAAPWLGGRMWWAYARDLIAAPKPALAFAGEDDGADLPEGRLSPTDFGRALLAGEAEWIAANGIGRWIGGVHLRPGAPLWYWDEAAERLSGPVAAPR